MVLLQTLRVENIDSWLSYEQFVRRGLSPAFAYIDNLGERLDGLRRRLQAVIEGIQTSALVAQASATRENTMELKKIGKAAMAVGWFSALASVAITLNAALQILLAIRASNDIPLAAVSALIIGVVVVAIIGWLLIRRWR